MVDTLIIIIITQPNLMDTLIIFRSNVWILIIL